MSDEIEHMGGLPRLKLPPAERPTLEEIKRRRRLSSKVMELRDRIGPIGRPVTDFIRQDRDSL